MDKKVIKIKCFSYNSLNIYKYYILVYDLNNQLIVSKESEKDGSILLKLPYYGKYRFIIVMSDIIPRIIYKTNFLYSKNYDYISLGFNYPQINNKRNPITIKLTDLHYEGLPIMKGEIKLWQNLM